VQAHREESLMSDERLDQLRRSWIANAASWSAVVREQKIESRRVATDAAILEAVLALQPASVLDLGCGEGWLSRALASHGIAVTGVDASPELIRVAQQSGGAAFRALSYEQLVAEPMILGDPFDVIVANFSLLDEKLDALLQAIAALLRPQRALVIQTVHPVFAAGDAYRDGWRVETFASFEGDWPEPMPWYFRTLASWVRALVDAGFVLRELREPLHPERLQPLSLLLIAARHG
jgi:2-polyprenyl-3-methyl-5-hydroxy-6-metoxy-1,4-benzoquinol methylase